MPKTIGENIRKYRKERGLTQNKLAQKSGIGLTTICNWENGRFYPNIFSLCDLADFFNCSTDELLGRKC